MADRRKNLGPPTLMQLTHSYREQARSHNGPVVNTRLMNTQDHLWERACSRSGLHLQHPCKLTHCFREQARSHNGPGVNTRLMDTQDHLWERACSRSGLHLQHPCKLTHRFREQARSHNGIGVRPGEPGRLSGRLASKLCSHRSCSNRADGCTTGRARSATRPPRGGR